VFAISEFAAQPAVPLLFHFPGGTPVNNLFIITPSYLMKEKGTFTKGIRQLERLGFHVMNQEFPRVRLSPGEKADQIHQAFLDPAVDIILAQRGGYSAMKLLPFLDFELIKSHPKIIAGFSDLSALLNPIFDQTGLCTLHAPMLTSLDAPTQFTLDSFMNAMRGFPEKNLFKGAPVKVYHAGTATGILKGGNLITVTALINTPWDLDANDSVLFFEDIDEKLHKVDRYLTQWILSGKLKGVKGIILGDFGDLKSRQVYDILASQMDLDFPVVHCPYLGHVPDKITMPIGALVELNTAKKQLVIKSMSLPGESL
jgi:muramoyltetrapeptide carboxypeptidase